MRKRLAVAGTTVGALGFVALASPAFAAGPIDTGAGVQVTITNPAAATVTLDTTTLALDATVNTSATAEAPAITVPGDPNGGQTANGGIRVQVVSNNGDGYSVLAEGPAGGFTSPGQTAMPNADFHVSSIASIDGNGHAVLSTNDLSAPDTILANSGPSGSVWDTNSSNASGRVAGTDETRIAAFINPNVLVGGKVYSGQFELFYVPTA